MFYAFDSSTISLCLKLCPWAKFRKKKGGIKLHTQLDLRGNLPVFVLLTKASVHDVNALDEICVEMGAIYLIDKGYVDFNRLFNVIYKNGAFFVTRAKMDKATSAIPELFNKPIINVPKDDGQLDLFRDLKS